MPTYKIHQFENEHANLTYFGNKLGKNLRINIDTRTTIGSFTDIYISRHYKK